MTTTFFGEFDLASLSLWLFFFFFVALVVWIQRENMREGYPLEDDEGNKSSNEGLFPLPADKTFKLPNGRGEVTVPSGQTPERPDLPLKRVGPGNGFPLEPTGDPMLDGVGPASWAPRRDVPELDGHGHPKIVPMSAAEAFSVSAGRDPRGLPVVSGDDEIVGQVTDMWIDEPEQLASSLQPFPRPPRRARSPCSKRTRSVATTGAVRSMPMPPGKSRSSDPILNRKKGDTRHVSR